MRSGSAFRGDRPFLQDVTRDEGFMSGLVDLVALTLLPPGQWRAVSEQLQAGWTAPAILEHHCDQRMAHAAPLRRPREAHVLRSRATTALDRASRQGIEGVTWT